MEAAGGELGMEIEWRGEGLKEVGIDRNSGREIIGVDPRYFRPTEVETLLGDPTKAKEKLGWVARTPFSELVKEMVAADHEAAQRAALIKDAGYKTFDQHE
jgi:GDPmannose 4,6-dehydratase